MSKQRVPYPVGTGMGEFHNPNDWKIWIPDAPSPMSYSNFLEINDQFPTEHHIGVRITLGSQDSVIWVSKALLCDIARRILDRYEPYCECFHCGGDVAICKAKCN